MPTIATTIISSMSVNARERAARAERAGHRTEIGAPAFDIRSRPSSSRRAIATSNGMGSRHVNENRKKRKKWAL